MERTNGGTADCKPSRPPTGWTRHLDVCSVQICVYKLGDFRREKAAHLDCCDCDAKYWMEREIGGWRTTTSKQPPRRYPCALSWRLWRTGDSIPDCYFCCTWDIWDGNILCILFSGVYVFIGMGSFWYHFLGGMEPGN